MIRTSNFSKFDLTIGGDEVPRIEARKDIDGKREPYRPDQKD